MENFFYVTAMVGILKCRKKLANYHQLLMKAFWSRQARNNSQLTFKDFRY